MTDHNQPEAAPSAENASENLGLNELNSLGNLAIEQGLIAGHGHRQGQYEIIREGEVVTLSPRAAVTYLQGLVQSANPSE